jgi:GntR family transcriptional regulator/MocR family aminotransferase
MTARRSAPSRPSRAGGLLPVVPLSSKGTTPLYDQLYAALRQRIVDGTLAPGTRLASTRAFSVDLGVSRFTVVTAFSSLIAEGYVTTTRGGGTYVARTLPEQMMRVRRPGRTQPAKEARVARAAPVVRATLSERGRSLSAVVITGPRNRTGEPRPFRPRRPPLDCFPFALWSRVVRRQWQTFEYELLDYGDPAGYRPLRESIAAHIAATRGVRCTADQIVVTSGAQQATDLLARLLLDPGDPAWIEEPGYLDLRGALVAAGAKLIPVPVDANGLDVDAGIALAPHARVACVSPSHQYPTGATLSASRRFELLAWAERAGAWIIEDDYDSYFRYRGRPLPALQRLDAERREPNRAERVIYVGTFSKTMFPSLRLGYCVVPDALVDAVVNARAVADRNSPLADQAALAAFIDGGHYDRHLRRIRTTCVERYEAIRHHVTRLLGDAVTLAPANAGTHVVAWLNGEAKGGGPLDIRVSEAAAADGMVIFPMSRYYIGPAPHNGIVLGYGGLTPALIASGVRRLARILERVGVE